jgi:hypothetical protein
VAERLRDAGESRAALAVLERGVRAFRGQPAAADLHAAAGDLLLRDLDDPTAAYQHFAAAGDGDPGPEGRARVAAGLAELAALQKRPLRRLDFA